MDIDIAMSTLYGKAEKMSSGSLATHEELSHSLACSLVHLSIVLRTFLSMDDDSNIIRHSRKVVNDMEKLPT